MDEKIMGVRAIRYAAIKETMYKAKKDSMSIEKEKLIAHLCMKWMAARRTIMEYLQNLKETEVLREFKVDDINYICWNQPVMKETQTKEEINKVFDNAEQELSKGIQQGTENSK